MYIWVAAGENQSEVMLLNPNAIEFYKGWCQVKSVYSGQVVHLVSMHTTHQLHHASLGGVCANADSRQLTVSTHHLWYNHLHTYKRGVNGHPTVLVGTSMLHCVQYPKRLVCHFIFHMCISFYIHVYTYCTFNMILYFVSIAP